MAHNVLLILSDEHARSALGCYGAAHMQTPNLDALASCGVRFDRAYTPSPICVPARASIATGRYVHQTGFWSNAQAYDGSVMSFGHRLMEHGHRVASVGKLHYRSAEDDNGFDPELIPLHIRDGVGWVRGLLGREPGATWEGTAHFAEEIGPGECDYTGYDRRVASIASDWLRREAPSQSTPWVLCASFVSPHYPLLVPEEYYALYDAESLDPPWHPSSETFSEHPVVQGLRRYLNYDDYFDDAGRQVARAAYFGLCSFLDHHVGQLMRALKDSGQADDTVVIYTSDHGELAGNRGLWTKCCMYEDSVGIPMIIAGPGLARGAVTSQPASLVDLYPTILQAQGVPLDGREVDLPGRSLFELADAPDPGRALLSEYHDGGASTGMFMLWQDHLKYVYYPGHVPQLFDLDADPREERDLAEESIYRATRADMDRSLRNLLDPDLANERAFADQARRIEELGGREGILATPDFDQSPVPGQ